MAETEVASAVGSAHNARVLTDIPTGELEAILIERRAQYEADGPVRLVAGLEASLAKHKANVANVQAALDAARVAQKGAD